MAFLVPASAEAKYGFRTLHTGSQGSDVKELQTYLSRVGWATPADGEYGRRTARNVRRFERRQGQAVDGRATPAEQQMLKRVAKKAGKTAPAETNDHSNPAGDSSDTGGSSSDGGGNTTGNSTGKATLSADGRTAVAPDDAPQEVKDAIDAANAITSKPYRYGGGHGSFEDSGYDCSGSVSYAMHGGGFLRRPLDSTGFESWGRAGRGTWITVYANSGHAYTVIAGLRFDTSSSGSGAGSGPRWRPRARSSSGYVARHPAGF
jgi:cell wall-associated NlpC family hydrolase